jgi:glycosyltransferase involved in cell wall biosynthesis
VRVLYCSESYGPHDHRFLSALRDLGVEALHLIAGSQHIDYRHSPAIHTSICDSRFLDLIQTIRRLTASFSVDIIHAGPVQTVAHAAVCASSSPVISMSWGSDLLYPNFYGSLSDSVATDVLTRSDGFIADCDTVLSVASSLGLAAPSEVFPWGVDNEKFRAGRARVRFGAIDDRIIFTNRSWEPLYNVGTIVKAFALALAIRPGLHLVIAGDGSEREGVHQLLRYLPSDSYTVLGRIDSDQMADVYRASDVYVSASSSDGSSISMLEAMSSSLPVVVTDIASNSEWVENDVNGLLFPVEDHEALANKLIEITAWPGMHISDVAANNRSAVEQRANWDYNKSKIIRLYKRVLNRHG